MLKMTTVIVTALRFLLSLRFGGLSFQGSLAASRPVSVFPNHALLTGESCYLTKKVQDRKIQTLLYTPDVDI